MILSCGEALVDVLPGSAAVPGGGPMNAAIAAARLGSPTGFVGRVSTDAEGDLIWSHLQASGVDLSLAERGLEPTAKAIVTTTPVQSFRFEGEDTADASMVGLDLSSLELGRHVVHGGTLGIFRGSTASVLADMIESDVLAKSVVSFDPNIRPQIIERSPGGTAQWWRYAERWLARADIVRGSDEDFDWMGVDAPGLLDRGPSVVLRTIGAAGVEAFFASGQTLNVAGADAQFVDAVGAGDSFCGAYLSQLHASLQDPLVTGVADLSLDWWTQTLEFAVRVAAATVSRPGADPPWLNELR